MFLEELGSPYLLLHAANLYFTHPFTGEAVIIKAQMPDNMLRLCSKFEWENVLKEQDALPQPVPVIHDEASALPSLPADVPPGRSEHQS